MTQGSAPDLDKLERLAEAAKAKEVGEQRFIRYDHGGGRTYFEEPVGGLRGSVSRDLVADLYDEPHRELYYALTSNAVLALLRRIRELEECKKRLRERLKWPYKDDYLGTHTDGFGDDPCEVGS